MSVLTGQDFSNLPKFCVDLQINGGSLGREVDGVEYLDFSRQAGITDQQCAVFTKRLAGLGVKAYLPTLVTAHPDVLEENIKVLTRFRQTIEGRHCPGIHLEAGFFNPSVGYIGAHQEKFTVQGESQCLALYKRLQKAADGGIRLMTVGPDVDGIIPTIRRAVKKDKVIVGIGHFGPKSEGRDRSEMRKLKDSVEEAIDAGASLSTHLGNGTRAMVHRHGAHISVQMAHPNLRASLIADGSHLPPEFIDEVISTKRVKQVRLVSDASPLEGAPDGEYELWGKPAGILT